jgi:hypothetical protein
LGNLFLKKFGDSFQKIKDFATDFAPILKILHLHENLMTQTHSSSKNLRTGQH